MLLSTHKILIVLLLVTGLGISKTFGQAVVYVTTSGAGDQSGSSWSNAVSSTSFRVRLASATSGTQFWVARGTYQPSNTNTRSESFLIPSGVQVYGGFEGYESNLNERLLTNPSSTTFSGDIGTVGAADDNSLHVVTFINTSSSTRLNGVVVTRGFGYDGGGILVNGSGAGNRCEPTITNCYISENQGMYGGGVNNNGYQGNASPTFLNCVFFNNRSFLNGGAVYNNGYQGVCEAKFINCLVYTNFAADGGAFYNEAYSGTCKPVLLNCTIATNETTRTNFPDGTSYNSAAFFNDNPGSLGDCSPTLNSCIIWLNRAQGAPGSGNGIYSVGSANVSISYSTVSVGFPGTGNDSSDPKFQSDFSLAGDSPAVNAGDPGSTTASVSEVDLASKPRIRNGRIDRGAYEYRLRYGTGFRLYVTPTGAGDNSGGGWNNALSANQLPDLLSDALDGTEFWIAAGLYKPTQTTSRIASFQIAKGLRVHGGFAGNESQLNQRLLSGPSSTTLSGDIGTQNSIDDNCFHVVTFRTAYSTTRLDGFVITGGNANAGGRVSESKGGGIYCDGRGQNNRCEPVIANCLVINNTAQSGGGLCSNGEQNGNASPTILNCVFQQNTASTGGGANAASPSGSSSPTFTDCKFLNNTASLRGGGLYYGGYFSMANDNVRLTNCTFSGNTASIGAGIYGSNSFSASLNLLLTNCLFDRNLASDKGGAVTVDASLGSGINTVIKNSTFVGNTGANSGNTIYTIAFSDTYCAFNITNSIIRNTGFAYDNGPNRIAPTYNITYSNIQGGYSGTGNIDADPLFVDPASGNYRLQPGSPSINTGDPGSTTANVSATDLAGNPRIDSGRIDMGAYERQTPTGPIVTLKEGNWNDPATWLYQQVPTAGDTILLRHRVGLPASYVGSARTVQYDTNGQLVFSPAARLVMTE